MTKDSETKDSESGNVGLENWSFATSTAISFYETNVNELKYR